MVKEEALLYEGDDYVTLTLYQPFRHCPEAGSGMKKAFPTIDKVRTGKQIRRIMDTLGLTVNDVQQYMGLSTQQAVYHWLNGRSLPTLDNIYALSELFRVPMDQIICGNRKYQPKYGYMYDRMKSYNVTT